MTFGNKHKLCKDCLIIMTCNKNACNDIIVEKVKDQVDHFYIEKDRICPICFNDKVREPNLHYITGRDKMKVYHCPRCMTQYLTKPKEIIIELVDESNGVKITFYNPEYIKQRK